MASGILYTKFYSDRDFIQSFTLIVRPFLCSTAMEHRFHGIT